LIRRTLHLVIAAALAAACSTPKPLPITPKSDKPTSPVIRENLPAPPTPPQELPPIAPVAGGGTQQPSGATGPSLASAAPSSASPAPGTLALPPAVPAGTLYVCAAMVEGQPRYTAIEYVPKVKDLCAKHPEMGVCQYEREQCRASGGRVYDAKGIEITKQIEAEYDRKVMRVRFRAG
jgi:hypothetical protein